MIVLLVVFVLILGYSFRDIMSQNGSTIESILPSVVFMAYFVLFESSELRGTVGKYLMNLQVRHIGDTFVNLQQAFIRNLLRFVFMFVASYAQLGMYMAAGVDPQELRDPEVAQDYVGLTMTVFVIFIVLFLLPYLIALGKKKQTLYDIIAKTIVTKKVGR